MEHCHGAICFQGVVYQVYCCNMSPTLLFVHRLGSMRPLFRDQPETLTQGYDPGVDSMVGNLRGTLSQRVDTPVKYTRKKIRLTSLSACLAHNDGRAGWSVFANLCLISPAVVREPTMPVRFSCFFCTAIRLFFHPGDGLLPLPGFAPRLPL